MKISLSKHRIIEDEEIIQAEDFFVLKSLRAQPEKLDADSWVVLCHLTGKELKVKYPDYDFVTNRPLFFEESLDLLKGLIPLISCND